MSGKRAVAIVVEKDGKIILGKKREDSKGTLSGEWHIPGETVIEPETDEQAVARGIKEEVGINVEVVNYICSHKTPKGTLVNWYFCKTKETDLIVGSDLEDGRWIPKEEVYDTCGDLSKSMWPDEVRALFSAS